MSEWFCLRRQLPVVETNDTEKAYGNALGIDPEKGTTSFDQRIRKEYRLHTIQYWFVASLANGLLWMQIIIGAALTALGAIRTSESQTATIYLGAASTITAGLLTYFKSRNQPNRSRQLRQALRGVRNMMDDQSRGMAGLTPEEAKDAARRIIKQYNEALAEAATNYPDLWMSLGQLRKFLPGGDPEDKEDDDQLRVNKLSGTKPNEHGTGSPTSPAAPAKQHGSQPRLPETQTKPKDSTTQSKSTSSNTQAPPAPRSNPDTLANPDAKLAEKQIDIDENFSPADEGLPEKIDRDTAVVTPAVDVAKAPAPTMQVPHMHDRGPVGVRRVGGMVLLE
ncbi:hypothetical protein C7974DRAFT_418338 [Boeremia exigua]|uniref:uncharacterized protein n=1 Tax=Boeremia exigua TaxID=749465 RepID=UPI001E8CCDBB|nr:uncharacterized protein C7974DRAFT_418338 [Boeremia exigua]KAH6612387.1 hypothetical protein C7974DRAFT_418338 [Boeremia exigua]